MNEYPDFCYDPLIGHVWQPTGNIRYIWNSNITGCPIPPDTPREKEMRCLICGSVKYVQEPFTDIQLSI